MFSVYILLSKRHRKTYVGYSKDVERRLEYHNSGKVRATKYYCPWELIYTEDAISLLEAKRRERYWKSGAGRRNIKRILGGSRPTFRVGRGSLKNT